MGRGRQEGREERREEGGKDERRKEGGKKEGRQAGRGKEKRKKEKKDCDLVDNWCFSQESGLTIMKLLYMYTRVGQINE